MTYPAESKRLPLGSRWDSIRLEFAPGRAYGQSTVSL